MLTALLPSVFIPGVWAERKKERKSIGKSSRRTKGLGQKREIAWIKISDFLYNTAECVLYRTS